MRSAPTPVPRLAAALFLAVLAACGGGSGDEPAVTAGLPSGTGSPALPVMPLLPTEPTLPSMPARPSPADLPTAVAAFHLRVLDPNGQAGTLGLNAAGQVAFTGGPPGASRALFFDGSTVQEVAGPGSRAVAVNAGGQVAGHTEVDGSTRAFLWTPRGGEPGVRFDLGTPADGSSVAEAVNAAGLVAGSVRTGVTPQVAFRWTPTTGLVRLDTLGGTANLNATSAAVAIDDTGAVAGNASTAAGAVHAVQWRPGERIRDLGTLGGPNSFARAMNGAGVVVGHADTATGGQHAFRADTSATTLTDLGTLGGRNSSAVGVNAAGQVAGDAETLDGARHAFRWTPSSAGGGAMTDLGTLGGRQSSAFAINVAGDIAGMAETATGAQHAVVWRAGGGIADLNERVAGVPAGLVLQEAIALTDRGAVLVTSNAGLVLLVPA